MKKKKIETVNLILRMPTVVHKKIVSAANKESRSLNNMINQILKEFVEQQLK